MGLWRIICPLVIKYSIHLVFQVPRLLSILHEIKLKIKSSGSYLLLIP